MRGRRAVRMLAAAVCGVCLAALSINAASAGADPGNIRVVRTSSAHPPRVTVAISVPGAASVALPPTAFQLWEDDEPRKIVVARLANEKLRLAIAVNTASVGRGQDLQPVRNAVAEMLVRLPDGAQAAVVTDRNSASDAPPLAADRGVALRTLDTLQPGDGESFRQALQAAVGQLATSKPGRRAVVLVTAAPERLTNPPELSDDLAAAGAALYVVTYGPSDPTSQLAELANRSGGGVYRAPAAADLVGAFDAVSSDLLSQYELSFHGQDVAGAQVRVAVGGPAPGSVTTLLDNQKAAPGSAPAGTSSRFPVGTALIIGALLAAALLVLAVGIVVSRRNRYRPAEARRPAARSAGVAASPGTGSSGVVPFAPAAAPPKSDDSGHLACQLARHPPRTAAGRQPRTGPGTPPRTPSPTPRPASGVLATGQPPRGEPAIPARDERGAFQPRSTAAQADHAPGGTQPRRSSLSSIYRLAPPGGPESPKAAREMPRDRDSKRSDDPARDDQADDSPMDT